MNKSSLKKSQIITIVFFLIEFVCIGQSNSFLSKQLQYSRFRNVEKKIGDSLSNNLKLNGLNKSQLNVVFVAYKDEGTLEIFMKNAKDSEYKLMRQYTICQSSGVLGPKSKSGDLQVPEGFYYIDRFNPWSSFHLSLGINYPNKADRKRSSQSNLGGDIFIHGSCVTIGCIPLTDKIIEEVYWYSVCSKNNKQNKIPVYIFPFRMNSKKMNQFQSYMESKNLNSFWNSLKIGYDHFFENGKEINFTFDQEGNYRIIL